MLNAQALASHRAPPALPIGESAPPSFARSALAHASFRDTPHARAFSVKAAVPGRADELRARAVIHQATDIPHPAGVMRIGVRDGAPAMRTSLT